MSLTGALGALKRTFIRDRTPEEEAAWKHRQYESKMEEEREVGLKRQEVLAYQKARESYSRRLGKTKAKAEFSRKVRRIKRGGRRRSTGFWSEAGMPATNFRGVTGSTSRDFSGLNILSGGGRSKRGKNMWSGLSGLVR